MMACGTQDVDDRPKTLEYITQAILQPTCAQANCHSQFTQAGRRGKNGKPDIPLVFDTVEHARATFQRDDKLIDNIGGEGTPTLIVNLQQEFEDEPRMPFDGPMPTPDIALIRAWIELGGPGVCVGAASCQGAKLVPCNELGGFDLAADSLGPCEAR